MTRERRRVEEEAEATGDRERHVVQRRAIGHPLDGLVIGEEVVAERVARDGQGRSHPAGERQHGEDRQRGPRQPGEGVAVHHTGSVAPRWLRRWMSGIRNRSHATRTARRGPARIRDPRLSNQRIGTMAIR